MSYKDVLSERLPYLRRYARALTGSQRSGDAYVRELLEAAVSEPDLREELGRGRVELYRAFTQVWANGHVEIGSEPEYADTREGGASARLGRIPAEHRQALLLTTLEDFSEADAASVLGLSVEEVQVLVRRAVEEIDAETASKVMIVEDEPLIAMQLEELVTELGHTVAGIATTRTEALETFKRTSPSLLLVDIQLADSSSGIDAVEEILAMAEVPVIFVTAYPERLLTGERPEPTYLVTKPFKEETIRATISQALFFGTSGSITE